MTGDRRQIRARLAAALDEAQAIESLPIDEVRAALFDLGVDPTASIRLAQRMASSGANDPAAALLQKLDHAETVDAEIAALEEADIDDIKAALSAETEGARRSDRSRSEKIVPIEPKQRRLSALGWSSSLIGIAASVLLFIAVRPDQLEQADIARPSIETPAPLARKAESADAAFDDTQQSAEVPSEYPLSELSQHQGKPSAGRDGYRSGRAEPAGTLEDSLAAGAEKRVFRSLDEEAGRPLAASRKSGLGEESRFDLSSEVTASSMEGRQSPAGSMSQPDLGDRERGEMAAAAPRSTPMPPQDLPVPAPRPDVEEDEGVETAFLASRPQPQQVVAADSVSLDEPPAELELLLPILADLRAVLLVGEASAPPSLRAFSDRLPEGRLAARLGEAELRAAGKKVVALIAFTREGEIVEAALVETPVVQTVPDPFAQTIPALTGFAGGDPVALSGFESSFELIELPAGR